MLFVAALQPRLPSWPTSPCWQFWNLAIVWSTYQTCQICNTDRVDILNWHIATIRPWFEVNTPRKSQTQCRGEQCSTSEKRPWYLPIKGQSHNFRRLDHGDGAKILMILLEDNVFHCSLCFPTRSFPSSKSIRLFYQRQCVSLNGLKRRCAFPSYLLLLHWWSIRMVGWLRDQLLLLVVVGQKRQDR